MKALLLLGLSMISAFSWGTSPKSERKLASKTDPVKILNCQIEYKANGKLNWVTTSGDSGYWIMGDKANATLKDSAQGPKVSLEALTQNKKDFYRIKIGKDGEIFVGTSQWQSLQITLGVEVTEPGGEDPATFHEMRVTCDPATAAG